MALHSGLPRGPEQLDPQTRRVLRLLADGKFFAKQDANTVLAGPATGADAFPAFRALVASDVPASAVTIGATVSGSRPYEFLYVDAALALRQSPNEQYRSGWRVTRNNGPPVLADLGDQESIQWMEAGIP